MPFAGRVATGDIPPMDDASAGTAAPSLGPKATTAVITALGMAAVAAAVVLGQGQATLHAQDPSLKWVKAAPFPEPEEELYGATANGKMYVVGGFASNGKPATAMVYEYDPAKKTFRQLVDLKKLLNRPDGHYSPAKIHTALTVGKDGYIYFGTHRGSTTVTTDKYHYEGDWLVRVVDGHQQHVRVHAEQYRVEHCGVIGREIGRASCRERV